MLSTTPKELIELLTSAPESTLLIDVRNQSEYDEVRLAESTLVPLPMLPIRIGELNTSKKIVFICRSGGRSGQACLFAEGEGIQAYNLIGGMNAIEKEYPAKVIRSQKKSLFSFF